MKKIPIKFYKLDKTDNNYITFIINTLNVCNYKCKYCCEQCIDIINPKSKYIDYNALYNFLIYFKSYNQKKIKISLYGGEPTLHPQLFDFCEKILNDTTVYLEIFSNFSADIKTYQSCLEKNIKFIITFHYTYENSHISFLNKIKLLNTKYLNNIIINIMFEHNHIYDTIWLCNELKEYYKKNNADDHKIILKIIRSTDTYNSVYSTQQLEIFLKMNQFSNYSQYNILYSDNSIITETNESLECYNMNFQHWFCNAGMTSYYINFTGKIYTCQSLYQFEKKHYKDMSISNIFNTYKKLLPKQTLCLTKCCTNYDDDKFNILKRNTQIKTLNT